MTCQEEGRKGKDHTVKWLREEENVLRASMRKYGCGNFQALIGANHLPNRSRTQLYEKTRRMLDVKNIAQHREYTSTRVESRRITYDDMALDGVGNKKKA